MFGFDSMLRMGVLIRSDGAVWLGFQGCGSVYSALCLFRDEMGRDVMGEMEGAMFVQGKGSWLEEMVICPLLWGREGDEDDDEDKDEDEYEDG
ncbi:hypothetical protein BOTCAL_0498g00030 [Botryotinia calthae]|uniref:Uncharacterized protein n=1 Tax=Botryotinia calthae TaxID=38488 RepID=A0A4Y8CP95_9HELO|nr:hypothetical protein BOTCAL_0498g00030 [Botryotinia calthae]